MANNLLPALSVKHAPLMTKQVTKSSAPQFTDEIRQLMKRRDRVLQKFKRSKSSDDWKAYKILRNRTRQHIRNAKQQLTSADRRDMPQSSAPGTDGRSAKQLSTSIKKPQHQNNHSLFSPNGSSKPINPAQHESELKEAEKVVTLLINSDSEAENSASPDLNITHITSENSQQSIKPYILRIVPKSEISYVLNTHPKNLLNYSIPISDSDSENERSNKVSKSSGTPSNKTHSDLVGSGDNNSDTTNNSKFATLIDDKKRQKPIEKRFCNSQEVEKMSQDHKRTKDSSKTSSKSSLKQNLNHVTSTEKSETKQRSKNNIKSSKKESLIKSLLSKTEESFTECTFLSDRKTKKSKIRKKAIKEVHAASTNKTNVAEPFKSNVMNSESGARLTNQKITCESSPPMVNMMLEDENNFQENLFSPVVSELVCATCRSWMTSKQVHFCECKLICAGCSQSTDHCKDCGLAFAEDKRFSKFHERISRLINRPCMYHSCGCMSFVKPGDEHESSCEYKPFLCFKCNKKIPKINACQHFETEHHLTRKNHDVKLIDFIENPISGKLEVCCYPSKHQRQVYLILNKSEEGENAQFLVNSGCDNDVIVKLLFSKKNSVFRYECDNKTNNDNAMFERSGLSFIDVSKEAINSWFKDECILDISVRPKVRKRKEEKNSNQQQSGILENYTNEEKKKTDPDRSNKRKKVK